MIIRCRHCGELMETEIELVDGMPIRCPCCEVKDVYRKTANENQNPAKPMSVPKLNQNPSKPRSVPKLKSQSTGDGSGGWVFMLVLLVAGGLAFCWLKSHKATDVPKPAVQNGSVAANESDEFEKQMREQLAREEAEREKQKAERMAELEKELQAERQRAEAEKEVRALVESVEKRFKTGPLVFASDFSEKKWPLKKDGTFYAIGRTYQTEQRIYEAKVENGKVAIVRAISPQGIEEIGAVDFSRERVLAVGDDGIVWIFGTEKAAWTEKAVLAQEGINPAKTELKELYPILKSWERIPEYKLHISLKPLNGGKSISMGVIDYGATVTARKIRDALLPVLRARREKSIDLPEPRLKTFKPNVVFYDGTTIKKGFGDITQVPRTFKFHGTDVKNQHDLSRWAERQRQIQYRAKERWQKLADEARRQERKMQEVRNENERLMQEYANKKHEILSKEFRGEEIEAEARKYVLSIERNRSKLSK